MIYLWHHLITLALSAATALLAMCSPWRYRSPHVTIIVWQSSVIGAAFAVLGTLFSAGLGEYQLGIVPGLASLVSHLLSGPSDDQALGLRPLCSLVAGVALAAGLLGVLTSCGYRTHRRRTRLRNLLALVATNAPQLPGPDVRVLAHSALAAYCLPGRHPTVVISEGTLQALTHTELAAVIAHEHAHMTFRHDLALFPFLAASRLFGDRRAPRAVLAEMHLLVEMCADATAARAHGPAALLAALAVFQHNPTRPSPDGALAVAQTAISQRSDRLAHPPRPLPTAISAITVAAAITLTATPISLFLLPL